MELIDINTKDLYTNYLIYNPYQHLPVPTERISRVEIQYSLQLSIDAHLSDLLLLSVGCSVNLHLALVLFQYIPKASRCLWQILRLKVEEEMSNKPLLYKMSIHSGSLCWVKQSSSYWIDFQHAIWMLWTKLHCDSTIMAKSRSTDSM